MFKNAIEPDYAGGFGIKPAYRYSLFHWFQPTAMKFYVPVNDIYQF